MKKMIIVLLLMFPLVVHAKERQTVTLAKCIDGDTAKFTYENVTSSYRFLAIDTKELNDKPYGPKAKEYTCNLLTNASVITVEYDPESNKQDKYSRELVWVFVDGKLLQEELIKEGLAEIKYIYGDYQYLAKLKSTENVAKYKHKGIWISYQQSVFTTTLNYINKILESTISLLEKL